MVVALGAPASAGGEVRTRAKIQGDIGAGPLLTWLPGDAPLADDPENRIEIEKEKLVR